MRHVAARVLGGSAALGALALALAVGMDSGTAVAADDPSALTRSVWACDHRKQVIVEGVAPDAKLDPARAQLVADILSDLMRYCEEEITAQVGLDQQITIRANGKIYERWTPGATIPTLRVSFGEPTADAVVVAAPNGQEAFAAAFGALGEACGNCHETYRLPQD